jgi:hypothetical protein
MIGNITLQNYDKRMEIHGKAIKQWGDEWPFLSRDPNIPSTANEAAWHEYFRNHLGGFPKTYQLYKNGHIRYLNMPEELPENFDPTYHITR